MLTLACLLQYSCTGHVSMAIFGPELFFNMESECPAHVACAKLDKA